MELIEEQTRMFSSQGEEDEGSGVSGETLEGLASLRWQREDGRMSRREGGQRTPTTHRVNTLSNAPGGQQTRNREDSDDDDEGENRQAMHTPTPVRRASGVVRDGQETQNDAPNIQQIREFEERRVISYDRTQVPQVIPGRIPSTGALLPRPRP